MSCVYTSIKTTKLLLVIGADQKSFSVEAQILSNILTEELLLAKRMNGISVLTNKGQYSPSSPIQSKDHYVSLFDIAQESCKMLNLESRLTDSVLEKAKRVENRKPHDVPNQSYTGPF